jgi:hypothetical protein
MSIGNPTIIAVTPHGPPNSHLLTPSQYVSWRKLSKRNESPCVTVENFIGLAPFIGDISFCSFTEGCRRHRCCGSGHGRVANMGRPSYDFTCFSFHATCHITCSRAPVNNVSSSQGDIDSFYRRILAHRMGGSLPSAART